MEGCGCLTKRIYLNYDWKFSDAYEEEMLIDENYSSYENINLPHTCKETPFNYFDENIYQMVSFYKKNSKNIGFNTS